MGYLPFVDEYEGDYKINIVNKPEPGESKIHFNIILFLVTIVTTISAGYLFQGSIIDGIAFSIAIMAIIGTHESAHFFAARKHGIKATLPYFIPAPTLIGTFGAVINVKSAIPTKNALFDLGVSGPIAGFLVAIPVLIVGFYLSHVAPFQTGSMNFYPPLIMQVLMLFTTPQIPAGYELYVHPVAFAGWVGIIITMLNLMPVAFLDGGHISRALFNEKIHQYVSIAGIIVTVVLGWYFMAILMAVFFLLVSKRHPGALDNVSKITKTRKIAAILVFIIFILCLSPAPQIF
ncbi:MAG: site-2 protease family protein [Methanobacterium sp.]|nr:site-2 protease family protein [Methanobacterium sp.]